MGILVNSLVNSNPIIKHAGEKLIRKLILLVCMILFPAICLSAAENKTVNVGVLAYRTHEKTMERWKPTIDSLARAIPGYEFVLLPMNYREINPAVEDKSIDFILTNTGHYVELEANQGINRMTTLVKSENGVSIKVFGGVLFTRADRDDINSITDLKEKQFLAVKRSSLGGFLVAWEIFKKNNLDPFSDFSSLTFNGLPQDDIVFKVLNKEADAGTVRTNVLEYMAKEGKIKLSDFKIINPRKTPGFPFIHSTQLYPEWPFAHLAHVEDDLVEKVTVALLNIKSNSAAAIAGRYDRWVPPLDYQSVHEIFTTLNTGPYQKFTTFTFQDVFKKYLGEIISLLVIVIVILAFMTKIIHLNQSLKKALSEVNTLQGFIPICSSCKKIRDDKGYWNRLEAYFEEHSDASFSHGMCPECTEEMYGGEDWYIEMKKKKEAKNG